MKTETEDYRAWLEKEIPRSGLRYFVAEEFIALTREVAPNGETAGVPPSRLWPLALILAAIPDELRHQTGVSWKLKSWWRSQEYNAAWDGHHNSHHLRGEAIDSGPNTGSDAGDAIVTDRAFELLKSWRADGLPRIPVLPRFTDDPEPDKTGSRWWQGGLGDLLDPDILWRNVCIGGPFGLSLYKAGIGAYPWGVHVDLYNGNDWDKR